VAPPSGEVLPDVRVVIVDDQEPYLQAMGTVVAETDGFVVAGSATSGENALLVVSQLRPDLVLMDVHLPGMDGIEATRRLTARPGAPVVLLLSTYDESHFDLAASGAAGFIAKATFGPDRLQMAWTAAFDGAIAEVHRVEQSE
jgi:DNA-binding NarL/FixJ family response regulator